jgi:transposase
LNPNAPLKREQLVELAREAPEAMVTLVLKMQEVIVELRAEVSALKARVAELEEQNRPPSAPHRRREDEKASNPKRPGRAPGHPGECRRVPEVVDEVIEVKLECCPHCRGEVVERMPVVQWIEELPVLRPHVTKLTTYEAYCARCDSMVRSMHERQTSTAGGCAGVQLGARALALAVELKHGLGLTFGKTVRALQLMGGLKISRGGLAQAFQRVAGKVATEQEALHQELLNSPVVHTDETSWWVNGPQSLWVFTTPGPQGITLYYVVPHRDRSTFHSIIPPDWKGMLITDCLSVYDGATGVQHKCHAHHLRALHHARLGQNPEFAAAEPWFQQVSAFFKEARELKERWLQLPTETQAQERRILEVRANELFERPRGDPSQESFRARIAKQRDHLLVFLDHPLADSTNNQAERQLRGAVIARKLSCGNKTVRGAAAWQLLASLAATCSQRAQDFASFLAPRLRLIPGG